MTGKNDGGDADNKRIMRIMANSGDSMAAISWKTPVSGSWTLASDWSGGVVPGFWMR
jgi:hypothetical protein